MPLESASYIKDLDPANPAATDALAQADDHMRLTKAVLKNSFPNIGGAVTPDFNAANGVSLLTYKVLVAGEVIYSVRKLA